MSQQYQDTRIRRPGASADRIAIQTELSLATLQAAGAVTVFTWNAALDLPPRMGIVSAGIHQQQVPAGPGLTLVTTRSGIAADTNAFLDDEDLFTGSPTGVLNIFTHGDAVARGNFWYNEADAPQVLIIRVNLTGCNFDDLTAGAFTIYLDYAPIRGRISSGSGPDARVP